MRYGKFMTPGRFSAFIPVWIAFMCIFSAPAQAGSVIEWFASEWPGPKNSWDSRAGNQTLFFDTYEGSAPQKGTDTLHGITISTVVFDGNDFFTTPLEQQQRLWSGLSEFSLTVVFRSKTPQAGASTDVHAFWNFKGILGFDVIEPDGGEFALGVWDDGTGRGAIAAASGLANDVGMSAGPLNDGGWHVVSLIVEKQGDDLFTQSLYADNRLVKSERSLAYSTGSNAVAVADQPFSVGQIRGGANDPFAGSIAAIRFDTTALPAAEIQRLHSTYLGLK